MYEDLNGKNALIVGSGKRTGIGFWIAIELKLEDFKRIIRSPKAPGIGLLSQFILLPAFTFVLTLIKAPSVHCSWDDSGGGLPWRKPFQTMTYLAKRNCAVSISMTAISTLAAIVMTSLNLSLWGSLNPDTAQILKKVSLSLADVFFYHKDKNESSNI